MSEGWTPRLVWRSEQPMSCDVCDEWYSGREASYLPTMCERAGCPGCPERGDLREVTPLTRLAHLRTALERIGGTTWRGHECPGETCSDPVCIARTALATLGVIE